jgi:hypothetical protein
MLDNKGESGINALARAFKKRQDAASNTRKSGFQEEG